MRESNSVLVASARRVKNGPAHCTTLTMQMIIIRMQMWVRRAKMRADKEKALCGHGQSLSKWMGLLFWPIDLPAEHLRRKLPCCNKISKWRMSIGNAGDVPNLKAIKTRAWEFLLVRGAVKDRKINFADKC